MFIQFVFLSPRHIGLTILTPLIANTEMKQHVWFKTGGRKSGGLMSGGLKSAHRDVSHEHILRQANGRLYTGD